MDRDPKGKRKVSTAGKEGLSMIGLKKKIKEIEKACNKSKPQTSRGHQKWDFIKL